MYDVITIGSAFQDVYVFSKKFRIIKDKKAVTGASQTFAFGTKIELDDILFEVGGGATNTANTFKRQGLRVACITRVGNDAAGEEVKRFLDKNNIKAYLVTDQKRRTAHSVIFLNSKGERTILVYRGAAHYFSDNDVNLKLLKNAKWLYISSLAGNLNLLNKIVGYARLHQIKVAINPGKLELTKGSPEKLRRIFKQTDLLLINREEALLCLRTEVSSDKNILTQLQKLCPDIVVVTNGPAGAIMIQDSEFYRIIIKPIRAVDATGAGDSFGSGFLAGLIRWRGDIKRAVALAVNNSAADIRQIGAKHGALAKNAKLNKVRFSLNKLS